MCFATDDNEGELDEGFCDELCDEGLAQFLVPDDPSNSSMIPTSALFEDFDLGVDMFDSTEQTIPTSEPLKSPFGHVPPSPAGPMGSPYQLGATATSPIPIPLQDIQSHNDYNEYLNQSHSNSSASPAYSNHSGYIPTAVGDDELAMLLSEDMTCDGGLDVISSVHHSLSCSPLPMTTCGQHTTACSTMAGMDFISHPVSYANSRFSSQVAPSFATPTLTSVHMSQPNLMDLAEASQLAAFANDSELINMATSQLESTPVINSSSDCTFPSTGNSSLLLSGVTNSIAGASVCSRSSQTHHRLTRSLSPAPNNHQARSPSPVGYHRHTHSPSPAPRTSQCPTSPMGSTSSGVCYYSPSPNSSYLKGASSSSPSSSKSPAVSLSNDEIVDMPFFQFKKILDDPTVDQSKKEVAKNIRKRGKNKVAAKNCRQKKIEVVMGLQQEVDKMKEEKKKLELKCQGFEREINSLKQRCSSFRSLAYSS